MEKYKVGDLLEVYFSAGEKGRTPSGKFILPERGSSALPAPGETWLCCVSKVTNKVVLVRLRQLLKNWVVEPSGALRRRVAGELMRSVVIPESPSRVAEEVSRRVRAGIEKLVPGLRNNRLKAILLKVHENPNASIWIGFDEVVWAYSTNVHFLDGGGNLYTLHIDEGGNLVATGYCEGRTAGWEDAEEILSRMEEHLGLAVGQPSRELFWERGVRDFAEFANRNRDED
jgi:hypothetical protein